MREDECVIDFREGKKPRDSPDPLKASTFVVVPLLIFLSQLFVHLLVLFVGFVLSAPCTGASEFCKSHGIVCVSAAPFAV